MKKALFIGLVAAAFVLISNPAIAATPASCRLIGGNVVQIYDIAPLSSYGAAVQNTILDGLQGAGLPAYRYDNFNGSGLPLYGGGPAAGGVLVGQVGDVVACPTRGEDSAFLCYSRWQSNPGAWPFSQAWELLRSGYWLPVAQQEVVTPTKVGDYYLLCVGSMNGYKPFAASQDTFVGGSGEVYHDPALAGRLGVYPLGLPALKA